MRDRAGATAGGHLVGIATVVVVVWLGCICSNMAFYLTTEASVGDETLGIAFRDLKEAVIGCVERASSAMS